MVNTAIQNFKKSELLRGGALAFVIKIFGLACAYVFTYVITRSYGAEAWGIFSLSLAILTISSIFGKFGTDIASMRLVSKFETNGNAHQVRPLYLNVLLIVSTLSILVNIILYLSSSKLAIEVFDNEKLIDAFQLMSFGVLPLSLISVNAQNFRGLKQIGYYSFFSNASRNLFSLASVSFLLICGCMNFSDHSLVGVAAYLIALYLAALISTLLWRSRLKSIKEKSTEDFSFKELISYSIPQIPTTTMVFINGWLDGIMLGIYMSEFSVGVYNVALKISTLLQLPELALNSISGAQISRAYYKKDINEIQNISIKATKIIFYTVLPTLIILFFLRYPILRIFGEEFTQAHSSLMILATGFFVSSYIGPVGQILTMSGKQKYINIVQIFSVAGNVLINIYLIPRVGLVGAAMGAVAAKIILNIGNLILVWNFYKIRTFYIPFLRR